MSKVVDVTIAYPNCKPLNLWNIISASRPPCVTHVHYRVFDIKEVHLSEIDDLMFDLFANCFATVFYNEFMYLNNLASLHIKRFLPFKCSINEGDHEVFTI